MTLLVLDLCAAIAAYLYAFARLADAARPLWIWAPPKLQPLLPGLVTLIPTVATGFEGVKNYEDLLRVFIVAVGAVLTAARGALPKDVYQRLSPEARDELRAARKGEPPPTSRDAGGVGIYTIALFVFLAPNLTSSCTPAMTSAVVDATSRILAEVVARSQQASTVIDMVEARVQGLPLPEDLMAKVKTSIAACRAANSAAVEAARGADVTAKAADAAFQPFREEWQKLSDLLRLAGVKGADGRFQAKPGEVAIPEPLAMKGF